MTSIDPGGTGAIANWDGTKLLSIQKMPANEDIYNFIAAAPPDERWVMEDVGKPMPGNSARSNYTFARHRAFLDAAFSTLGIKPDLVRPQLWIKEFLGDRKPTYEMDEMRLSDPEYIAEVKRKLYDLRKTAIWEIVKETHSVVYKYEADAVALGMYINNGGKIK